MSSQLEEAQLEEALSRTLSGAASAAPEHPPGLLGDVERRHRKRRRRGYAAVAALAVFAVTVAALAFGGLPGDRRGPGVGYVPAADGAEHPPIADMWPGAYHALSAKLDDGREYRPTLLVNERELLVITEASFEVADEIWIINLDDRRARRVTFLPEPHENQNGFASHFTVGSGHVVWWDSYRENGKPYTRIWKAPLSGGEATLVSRVRGAYGSFGPGVGDRLVVADGTVYLSHSRTGGVRQAPLSGGETTAVAGAQGHHILQWPWVGKPAGGPLEPMGESEGEQFTTIRNVKTGVVREVVEPDGVTDAACHVTYCIGVRADPESRRKRELGFFRRSGSEFRPLSARVPPEIIPAWDRFLVIHSGDGYGLYDLKAGRAGDFGLRPDGDGGTLVPGVRAPDRRLIAVPVDGGKSYGILDLGAIR